MTGERVVAEAFAVETPMGLFEAPDEAAARWLQGLVSGVGVERGSVFFYRDGYLEPSDVPAGLVGVPVYGSPDEVVSAFPEQRTIGRAIRRLATDLRDLAASGTPEPSAWRALVALADELDPEQATVDRAIEGLREA